MKKILKGVIIAALFLPAALLSEPPTPLSERMVVINFEGSLADAEQLRFDGHIDVEAWFYRLPSHQPSDSVYAEAFTNVQVHYGVFRVPLLSGTPLNGTAFSVASLFGQNELYVDIKVNGVTMLAAWSVGSQLAAIRAEQAVYADALRLPLSLSPSDILQHPATLITTGTLNLARIPSIPADRIQGVFSPSFISSVDAGKVASGTFETAAFPDGVAADWFTTDTLAAGLIPDEVMRTGDIGLKMGTASNGTAVEIPSGFSRSQCVWMLSLANFNEDPGLESGIDHIQVLSDPNGVVTCLWDSNTGDGPPNHECTVNYITICKK
jgi:hypothetical protein